MKKEEIKTRIIFIMFDEFNHVMLSKEKITEETKLDKDLKMDSLHMVELVMSLEEEFGIEISDEDAEKYFDYKNIGSVIDYITEKIKGE